MSKKPKVLILEDSKERIVSFRKHLEKKYDLYFYDSVKDAIEAINLLGPFEILFLDHDLDNEIYVPSTMPNTGYQLAKYVAEHKIEFYQIIVHSMNTVGAQNIKDVLPEAIIAPFCTLFS